LLILRAALACHTGMATFAEAGVSDKPADDGAEPKAAGWSSAPGAARSAAEGAFCVIVSAAKQSTYDLELLCLSPRSRAPRRPIDGVRIYQLGWRLEAIQKNHYVQGVIPCTGYNEGVEFEKMGSGCNSLR
jgi:hypothetical protein